MTIENVRIYFKQFGIENKIREFPVSSATVELAAQALHTEPARIAKTLSFKIDEMVILIVCAGDTKVDNHKYKQHFGQKAKMLTSEEVWEYTGHAIGGVCPFGLKNQDIKIYFDQSLKRFTTVFPACGSSNSAIELTPEEIFDYSRGEAWVDVCKIRE